MGCRQRESHLIGEGKRVISTEMRLFYNINIKPAIMLAICEQGGRKLLLHAFLTL